MRRGEATILEAILQMRGEITALRSETVGGFREVAKELQRIDESIAGIRLELATHGHDDE